MTSASSNRFSKDVRIETVVVAELKFSNVQRHIFRADFVERADHAALEDRPEALNRVGVNRTDDILALAVVNRGVREFLVQPAVAVPSIGCEQANLVGYNLVDEIKSGFSGYVFQNARHDVALTLHSADQRRLAGRLAATHPVVPLIPMTVAILAANIGFINLDNASKLCFRLNQRRADFVAHAVRRLVRAKAHLPLNLQRANSFLAGQHQVYDLEPLPQRLVGVLKDRARDVREAIALIWRALVALPLEGHRANRKHFHRTTARANHAVGPTSLNQIRLAGILIASRKHGLELGLGHLVNWLGAARCHFRDSLSLRTGNESQCITFSVPVKRQIIALAMASLTERDSQTECN
jgi:hypothetical protein